MVARGCSESRSARMRKPGGSTLAALLVLGSALFSAPASAFLDPPYITPANPTSDDAISINVYGGECDVLNIGIVPPVVEQNGGDINILFTGIHEGDPEWCYFGVGTVALVLGRYPPGSYVVEVDRRYLTIFATWTEETLGVIPLTVTGDPVAKPIVTPTLSKKGVAFLQLTLAIIALYALRKRSRHH